MRAIRTIVSDMNYQIPSRNDSTEYSLQALAELWGREDIGPRTLVRNTETGEEWYLDQVVHRPAMPVIAPQDSVKFGRRGWVVGLSVFIACSAVLGFGGFQTYMIQQREAEALRVEARGLLVQDYKVMMQYVKQNNGKFPSNIYDPTPLMKIKVDGQSYVESGSKGTRVMPNTRLDNKKLSDILDPSRTVLFSSISGGMSTRMPLIALDGTIYEIDQKDIAYAYNPDMVPASAKPWKPQR